MRDKGGAELPMTMLWGCFDLRTTIRHPLRSWQHVDAWARCASVVGCGRSVPVACVGGLSGLAGCRARSGNAGGVVDYLCSVHTTELRHRS